MFSMSVMTALSRVTGYIRTMIQAAVIGSGTVVSEAYTFSNTLPNQIYELFMGGLLSSIFIPLLVQRLTHYGEKDARRLTNALITLIVPFLTVVAILGIVFASPLVNLITDWKASRNLSPEEARRTTDLAVLLFRVFALQVLFYGTGALAMGVLNSHRRFILSSFVPVLNNLIVIASFVGYMLVFPRNHMAAIYLLAWGTTLGVAIMPLVMLPAVWRLGYRLRPVYGHPSLAPAARLAAPMLIFVAASVGIQVAVGLFGSSLGGVSDLWYAFSIFQLPYGVFVVAVATALMPELSEKFARGDTEGYRQTFSFGLRTMVFVVVPAAVGMISLSKPIIGLLYERVNFTAKDTNIVASLLVFYGVGLLGYAAYFILVRSFYARQNTRAPATLNVILLGLYILLAHLLSKNLGLDGVALAFSAAYTVVAVLLLAGLRRNIRRLDGHKIARSLSKIFVAGAVMYLVARTGISFTGPGSDFLERAVILVLVGGVSLAAYLGVALLLRTEELHSVASLLKRRQLLDSEEAGKV